MGLKYQDEYRDPDTGQRLVERITRAATNHWTIMEVCGGQTHAIVRYGIDQLLRDHVTLLHGPGCPVCVTPRELIDQAVSLCLDHGVTVCSFGDMLRVPGSRLSLLEAKAQGGDVRMVYSPLDALRLATNEPDRQVVFFAVGFETTCPTTAMTVAQAKRLQLGNFSLLVSHVLAPPAMEAILDDPDHRVDGFLAAGHVCAVMGLDEYEAMVARRKLPIVVTGFEPLDILQGIAMCVEQLEAGRAQVENQYARAVRREGNEQAIALMREVFEPATRQWRGLGAISMGGLVLREGYAQFDAAARYELSCDDAGEQGECIAGQVLRGLAKPSECPAFGSRCTPSSPLGAPMVSSEGACAAYYRYRHVGQSADAPASVDKVTHHNEIEHG